MFQAISFFLENNYTIPCHLLIYMNKKIKWTRKAILQKSSLYLCMPSDWARSNNVGRYTKMDISMLSDGSLKITKHKEDE